VDCSPCMLRDCPIDHRCMTRVSAETVANAARELLKT
jgi:heptosyltransferase-2